MRLIRVRLVLVNLNPINDTYMLKIHRESTKKPNKQTKSSDWVGSSNPKKERKIVIRPAETFIAKHGTPHLKTAKWSWYCRGCNYHSSIRIFLELYLRRDLEHNVTSSHPKTLFQKDKNERAVATAQTVPRPFCSQGFQKWGIPYLGMNILAGCTTMNFYHGTPNARVEGSEGGYRDSLFETGW